MFPIFDLSLCGLRPIAHAVSPRHKRSAPLLGNDFPTSCRKHSADSYLTTIPESGQPLTYRKRRASEDLTNEAVRRPKMLAPEIRLDNGDGLVEVLFEGIYVHDEVMLKASANFGNYVQDETMFETSEGSGVNDMDVQELVENCKNCNNVMTQHEDAVEAIADGVERMGIAGDYALQRIENR